MSYLCPLCNALQSLDRPCPKCRHLMEDHGRLGDFYGDYSPYRPIDDIRLTNGYLDLMHHECVHVFHCPNCGHTTKLNMKEWKHKNLHT